MKIILPLLLLFNTVSYAQTADFIILKKKGKTLQSFFAGNNLSFTTVSGAYINAQVNGIKNDTLYLQEFIISYIPSTIGTYIIDTLGSYHYKFHYNQISAIGRKEKKSFNTRGSGASLLGGGLLLTLASGVVFLADRKNFSAPLLITAASLGTLGYFMAKGSTSALVIGKKYKLVYMDMHNTKN